MGLYTGTISVSDTLNKMCVDWKDICKGQLEDITFEIDAAYDELEKINSNVAGIKDKLYENNKYVQNINYDTTRIAWNSNFYGKSLVGQMSHMEDYMGQIRNRLEEISFIGNVVDDIKSFEENSNGILKSIENKIVDWEIDYVGKNEHLKAMDLNIDQINECVDRIDDISEGIDQLFEQVKISNKYMDMIATRLNDFRKQEHDNTSWENFLRVVIILLLLLGLII